MNIEQIKVKIDSIKTQKGTEPALNAVLEEFRISHPMFAGFLFRPEADSGQVVFTTEGYMGQKQYVRVPENVLEFPIEYIAHMLAHEFIHVDQRSNQNYSGNKEDREFEAYFHGVFPTLFQLPPCPNWLRIQFCRSLDKYFARMPKEQQEIYATRKMWADDIKMAIETQVLRA